MSWVEGFGWQPNDPSPFTHGFKWLKQSSEAERRIQSENLSPEMEVDIQRYIGHCYLQAAYQSANESEFGERMRKAAESFHEAASAAKSMNNNQGVANAARFSGIEQYCLAQLASETGEVLEHLHHAFNLLTEAIEVQGDKTLTPFPSLPLEIVSTTNDIFNYEADVSRRLERIQKALHATEPLDDILVPLTEDLRVLFLTELCELNIDAWVSLPQYDQRERVGVRALEIMKRIRELVRDSMDPRILTAAYDLQTESSFVLPSEPPLLSAETLEAPIKDTGDKLALGSLFAAEFRRDMYSLDNIEDPEKAHNSFEAAKEKATNARSLLKTFPGIRRFVTGFGYVHWTYADLLMTYAKSFTTSLESKRKLAKEAVEISHLIGTSPPPTLAHGQYSNLGFYVYEQALLEPNEEKRRSILEEAYKMGLKFEEATHLHFPYWEWGDALHFRVYARIKRELARISPQDSKKKELEDAVEMYQKAANCILRVLNSPLATDPESKNRSLLEINYEQGTTLLELYQQSRSNEILEVALKNLRQSADRAAELAIPTRAGEALTRIADALLRADRFEEARKAFLEASQRYKDAATHYPGLAELFNSRAQLLQARSIVADALASYRLESYAQAATHYRDAANLLQTTGAWKELTPLYEAWALLAEAEDHQNPSKARATTEAAIRHFSEAEKTLNSTTQSEILNQETLQLQQNLLHQGRGYAETKLLLEDSRELQRSGKLTESAEKLGEAAKKLHELAAKAADAESQDFMRTQATLCHASQTMLEAEQSHNPELYTQAAGLFQEAQKTTKQRILVNSAGGWAACCKALETGIRYRQSGEKTLFEALKKQLTVAHDYFIEAGSNSAATWVTATQRMFDAVAYVAEAEASLKPDERKALYEEAQQNLQAAAEKFERAGFTSRREDALRHLEATIENTSTLSQLLPTPPVVQSVSGITAHGISQQLLVGSEILSSPPLQAALKNPEGPLRVGHETELLFTVLNTGQKLALLDQVESLSCPDLEIRSSANEFPLIDGSLQVHEKRLPYLSAWQLPLILRPRRSGTYTLKPRIVFKDQQGQRYIQNLPALSLEATEMGVRGWLKGPSK